MSDFADSDSSTSSSDEDEENVLKIEKKYVDQAIEMIYTPDDELEKIPFKFRLSKGPKVIRECQISGLKSIGLVSTNERSTSALLNELHTCLSKHDFKNVSRCLNLMLNKSSHMLPVIWKTCFILLLNHPNSSKEIVEDFLQVTSDTLI
uniref:Uncharacterized protein n=1 Tax=Clastoptera arizonana TaxID=38151 RepID=A0A1B6EBW5_9HEMI